LVTATLVAASATLIRKIDGGYVSEEQVIALLEEIRDLQKQHVENYKDALKNQQQSIEIQRAGVRRQRISLLCLFVLLAGFLMFITWSAHR
jgi:predicted ATP-dependent protease